MPHSSIRNRIADLAVGLASDCDKPEPAVEQLLRSKLPTATSLPLVAFITADGTWVEGYSGGMQNASFLKVLTKAENTPSLQATPAVRKKITGLLKRAEKAAATKDWKSVMRAHGDAAKSAGRCPERTALLAVVQKARAAAVEEFRTVVKLARDEGDATAAKKILTAIKRDFRGEPEAAEATEGIAALRKLAEIRKKGESDELRAQAAESFKGKRWAALFGAEYARDEDDDDGQESVIE